MYLDFHAHCNSSVPEEVRRYVENCEKNETMAALSGGLHYGGHDYEPNATVIALCRQYPHNLIPLGKIDLWNTPPDLGEVRHLVDCGVKGFKFIYPYYGYDHESYFPVYEELEKLGVPALFHTGEYRQSAADVRFRRPVLDNMSPLRLDTIARSFQKLHLVVAHMGTRLYREQVGVLVQNHPNLYFDLAGSGAFLDVSPADLARLLKPCVFTRDMTGSYFNKLVFGSDSYIKMPEIQTDALAAYRNILLLNQIPAAEQKMIMGGTVASWMGINL